MIFKNRQEAAKLLAEKLEEYLPTELGNVLILAIPRGGVVVGGIVAKELRAPLDVVISRKIGHPYNPEYAVAAVDEDGEITFNPDEAGFTDVTEKYLNEEAKRQIIEIKRRLSEYRRDLSSPKITGKVVIIVDDGIATGLTTISAIRFIKNQKPNRIILAVPVLPTDRVSKMKAEVDELVYLEAPAVFFAVGQFYQEFPQTSDEEVKEILRELRANE